MKMTYKVMFTAYFLPIIPALIVLPTPEYDPIFAVVSLVIYLLSFFIPVLLFWKYRHRKKRNRKNIIVMLTCKYMLYMFCMYFTFPLLKIIYGNLLILFVLVAFFIAIPYLARYDQNTEAPIIDPGTSIEPQKKSIAYLIALPVILLPAGGSNYLIARQYSDLLGYDTYSIMTSTSLYLFTCWFLFMLSSMLYKRHVKEEALNL